MESAGSIEIDTTINDTSINSDVARINASLSQIGNNMGDVGRSMEQRMERVMNNMNTVTSRSFRNMSLEAQTMYMEMRTAFSGQTDAMFALQEQMVRAEYRYFELARTSQEFNGSIEDFMGLIGEAGARAKAVQDAMLNANEAARAGFYENVGMMMNMSTQASKISAEYTRMGSAMLGVNRAGLAVADSMNRIANHGDAAVLALRQLGPTASMKQLVEMQEMITQGQTRFQMVAMASLVTVGMVYSGLHSAAMDSVSGYEEAFTRMTSLAREAIQPMVEVFGQVMMVVYNFTSKILEMVVAFNEANPALAKLIQGIIMLVPALMLVLSPLAVGIGLSAGLLAAWNSIWMLIGPLITGLAAMSGTVWLVAAAIGVLTAALIYAWNNFEGFRNAVVTGWNMIVSVFQVAIGYLQQGLTLLIAKFNEVKQAFVNAFSSGDWSVIVSYFAQLIPTVIGVLIGGLPALLLTAMRFIPTISEGIMLNAATLSETIALVFQTITTFIATWLPLLITEGIKIIQNIITGIITALPLFVEAITMLLTQIVTIITTMLPVLIQAGIMVLQALIDGILTLLPVLIATALQLIQSVITTILTALPQILEAGVQIITTLIEGIVQMLPMIIETAMTTIITLIDAIVAMLPQIIETGMQILTQLIEGILNVLPQLIETAMTLIMKIVETIISNLPKIIQAGVQILTKLIEGITKVLPQLITTAVNLVTKVATTILSNLPDILNAGIKLLGMLVKGILDALPQLITAAGELIITVVSTIVENLPEILEAGVKIIKALIDGIIQMVGDLGSAITSNIIPAIVDTISEINLETIGKNIVQGLIKGISSMIDAVKKVIGRLAGAVKSGLAKALDTHSPSRWTRDHIGKMIPAGIAVGIDKNTKVVDIATARLGNRIKSSSEASLQSSMRGVQRGGDTTYSQTIPSVNLNYYGNGDETTGTIMANDLDAQLGKIQRNKRYVRGA